jgi:hypothetical protein
MTDADKADLQKAVSHWTKVHDAIKGSSRFNQFRRNECMKAIRALEKEIETGEPHCTCHCYPTTKCPEINS